MDETSKRISNQLPAIPYKLHQPSTWQELNETLGTFNQQFIFRGQSDSTWGLQTSLERAVPHGVSLNDAENYALWQFQKFAHLYVERQPLPRTRVEWLALMQHYGTPTRLLDWTYSPYVATYFALEHAKLKEGEYSVVWALHNGWCIRRCIETLEKYRSTLNSLKIEYNANDLITGSALQKLFRVVQVECIFPVYEIRGHHRLSTQQGLFVSPGSLAHNFADNLLAMGVNGLRSNLHAVIIPKWERNPILRELERMNINRGTLFPGLDGFAQSVGNQLTIFGEIEYRNQLITTALGEPDELEDSGASLGV